MFSNQKFGVDMHRICGAVRYHKLVTRGFESEANKYKHTLEKPGQIELAPWWCYQMPGEAMVNGTETVVDLEPTALSDEQLIDIVCNYIAFCSLTKEEEVAAV